MNTPDLPLLAKSGPESTQLPAFLDYFRVVFLRKAWGLDAAQLATAVAPSSLTLGGLLYHMTLVEDSWFDVQFLGNDEGEPWASVDWDAHNDWEFDNAHKLSPDELVQGYQDAVARSQETIRSAASLDELSKRTKSQTGEHWDLRWIVTHMIEEYARHCGHADYLREAIDGATGD